MAARWLLSLNVTRSLRTSVINNLAMNFEKKTITSERQARWWENQQFQLELAFKKSQNESSPATNKLPPYPIQILVFQNAAGKPRRVLTIYEHVLPPEVVVLWPSSVAVVGFILHLKRLLTKSMHQGMSGMLMDVAQDCRRRMLLVVHLLLRPIGGYAD